MSGQLVLAEPFASLWRGRDPFAEVERLPGQVYRALEGRRTLRTEVDGCGYFVKIHHGVGWREIFKNSVRGRTPVLGAGNEWRALQRLAAAGVASMRAVAFGVRGANPARQQSFIITEELAPTLDLEHLIAQWQSAPPAPAFKRALIIEVARLVAGMHRAGVNHRDCYLCHFLLHSVPPPAPGRIRLSLIDLHRAQTRARVPTRWRNKDLAGLAFSALGAGLTRRDPLRFLRAYFGQPLRQILRDEARLLTWLARRAQHLQARYQRKYASPVGSVAARTDAASAVHLSGEGAP